MPKQNKNTRPLPFDGDDAALYYKKEAALLKHFRPETEAEAGLVRSVVRHRWLVGRAIHWQNHYLAKHNGVIGRDFSILLRYQSQNVNSAHKYLKLFLSLRKEAALRKIGFVSQNGGEPATLSKIHPEIADKWADNTAVYDEESGEYLLLRVLRDRERERNERRRT